MCGDIRTLYTGRKHEGFVLITYYDGHGGNFAKAAMQGKQLMGRNIHIELSQTGQKVHDKDTQAGERVTASSMLDPHAFYSLGFRVFRV